MENRTKQVHNQTTIFMGNTLRMGTNIHGSLSKLSQRVLGTDACGYAT
jgi:hypothetical protein